MLTQFSEVVLIGFISVLVATGLFYEYVCLLLRFISSYKLTPRRLLYTLITGIFLAHGLTVSLYAIIYWLLVHWLGYGELSGVINNHYTSYLYYSATTYSSLGVGDIFSEGGLRLLTGLQAINGLVLITWSATISYFN